MTKTSWIAIATPVFLLCACSPPPMCNPEEEICDTDAGPPPDICNTKEEALSDTRCHIPVNTDGGLYGYISVAQDSDFYLAQMPTLDNRSLVHIVAAYGAPATPVNLAVSVLKEDGVTGLARKIDKHGAAAPRPVDIVFPYSESNAKLLVVLSDEQASTRVLIDEKNEYFVKAEVIQNPDLNEPNDTTPTRIMLTASGGMETGQGKGALATDDDVDKFVFTAPSTGRKILYLHITAPKLTPQALARVAYKLFDPTGKPVSEGQALNEFVPVDLATARLLTGGDYTLEIRGYKPSSSTAVIPGDLRLLYTVDVQIMDDLDTQEPNDSVAAPRVVALGYGAGTSITGRLGYVPDPDVFAFDLAATGNAGVLHYRLRFNATQTGRFPPLAPVSDRQVRVVTQVNSGTLAQSRNDCKTSSAVCPKGYSGALDTAQAQLLVEGLCDGQDPPWCLRSERTEDPQWMNLRNMEGTIPVPGHAAVARYFLFVQDDGNNYADDRDYTLEVTYEADPDETTRAASLFETSALVENASFPVPVGAGVTGNLSHGYGRIIDNRVDQGQGVRGPNDYDAVPSDVDRFEFTLPALAVPQDRTWALEWELSHLDAGSPPSSIALDVSFCSLGTLPDGGCMGIQRVMAYSGDTLSPWYSGAQMDRGVLWTRTVGANSTTITAQPHGCFCIDPRTMSSGHFLISVGAIDRNRYDPTVFTVRQSLAPYPPASFMFDGGSVTCPTVADGGASCRFQSQN